MINKLKKLFQRTKPSIWEAPSGKKYTIHLCCYTNSYFIICPKCKRDSECIGDCCDYCREDSILWNEIEDERLRKVEEKYEHLSKQELWEKYVVEA